MSPDPRSQLLKGALPLLVLGVLADGELYGYEISQRLAAASGGAVDPSEGSLYPVLHRLERDGAVTATWRTSDRGPKRRYYRLTESGARQLADERSAWREFAGVVGRLVGGPADA